MKNSGVIEKKVGEVQDMDEGCWTVGRCSVGVKEELKVETNRWRWTDRLTGEVSWS